MIYFHLNMLLRSHIVTVLLPLTALDYLTGLGTACITKEVSSKIGSKGLFRKIMLYLGIMAVGVVQEILPDVPWLFPTFVMFFIINESISILENLDKAGIRLPTIVVNALLMKRDEYDKPQE